MFHPVPRIRIQHPASTLQPGYENHETNPIQEGVSTVKSVTSDFLALLAREKRTQFSPDIPRGGDSLSPPQLEGVFQGRGQLVPRRFRPLRVAQATHPMNPARGARRSRRFNFLSCKNFSH